MSNILGSIQVVLTANTSTFASDLDKASAKARASSAQIRKELRGIQDEANATQSLFGDAFGVKIPRHLRTVISELPGVGKALSAAFSAVAIIVVIDTLIEAGKKVGELAEAFKKAGEAGKQLQNDWTNFNLQLKSTNDELQVTNDKLADNIAILEGGKPNLLKTQLDELIASADKLGASLGDDIEKAIELLDKDKPGFLARTFGGAPNVDEYIGNEKSFRDKVNNVKGDYVGKLDADYDNFFNQKVGGERNEGGSTVPLTRRSQIEEQVRKGHEDDPNYLASPDGYNAVQHLMDDAYAQHKETPGYQAYLKDETEKYRHALVQAAEDAKKAERDTYKTRVQQYETDKATYNQLLASQASHSSGSGLLNSIGREVQSGHLGVPAVALPQAPVEPSAILHNRALDTYDQIYRHATSQIDNSNLTAKKEQLDEQKRQRDLANQLAQPQRTVASSLASFQQQVDASKQLLNVSKQDEETKRKTLATNRANLEIVQLGRKIAEQAKTATGEPRYDINKMSQQQVMALVDKTKPGAAQKIREAMATIEQNDAQAKLNDTIATATRTAQLHIAQSNRLTDAIQQGSKAVQEANAYTQAENELRGQNATAVEKQARAQEILREAQAKGKATAAQTLQDLALEQRQQTALNAALLKGADAYRIAQLNKKLAEIDASTKGDAEKSADKQRAIAESQAVATSEIYTDVAKLVNADDDRLKILIQEYHLLRDIHASQADIKKVTDEIGTIWDKQRMDTGKAKAGAEAYFDEFVRNAKNAAQVVHDMLSDAVEGINDNLAKAMTGQNTNFGTMFRGLAEKLAKQTLESIEASALKSLGFGNKPDGTANNPLYVALTNGAPGFAHGGGSLKDIVAGVFKRPGTSSDKSQGGISSTLEKGGSILGLDVGKPDGSAGNPFHVVNDGNGGGGISSLLSGGDGSSGGLGSIFSGGDSSDSSDSGIDGFAANGGDLNSYGTYVVGERGPELFSPGVSGHVTPNHKLGGGGGRSSHTYNIDARGTNAAEVDMRVRRGMQQTHAASVQNAVVMSRELDMRRPSSKSGARF